MINILKLRKMQKNGGAKSEKEEASSEVVEQAVAEPKPAPVEKKKNETPSAKVETVAIPQYKEAAPVPEEQNPENLMADLPKVEVKAKEPEKPAPAPAPKPVEEAPKVEAKKEPEPVKKEEKKEEPKAASEAKAPAEKTASKEDVKKDVIEEIIQLVGFNLGSEYYGVEITKIHEIIRMVSITRVPRTPSYIEGVINLRGSVLPVVNLRAKVKMEKKEYDKSTRIVVVDLNGMMVSFIVDSVQEVIRIPKSETQPPPDIISGVDSKFFNAVAKLNDRLLVILDIEKVLTNEEKKDSKKVA